MTIKNKFLYLHRINQLKQKQMETKHTKGEWRVAPKITNGINGFEIHYSDDGECITDHVYKLEDAKLIAAAPELLEALIEGEKHLRDLYNTVEFEGQFPVRSALDKMFNAIKKATE